MCYLAFTCEPSYPRLVRSWFTSLLLFIHIKDKSHKPILVFQAGFRFDLFGRALLNRFDLLRIDLF